MIGSEQSPKPHGAGNGAVRKRRGGDHRREARDRDNEALVAAMRATAGASMGELGGAMLVVEHLGSHQLTCMREMSCGDEVARARRRGSPRAKPKPHGENAGHVDFAERAQTKRAPEGTLSLSSKGARDSGAGCGLFVWREGHAILTCC